MTFQHNSNGNWYTPDTSRGQYLVFNPASGQLVIAPEPSTVVAALGLAGLMLWPARRRLVRDARSILGLRAPMRDRLASRHHEP
jgi:hypothetical protein